MSVSEQFLRKVRVLLESHHFLVELAGLLHGDRPCPDLPDPPAHAEVTDDEREQAFDPSWVLELMKLDEELEHVTVFGILDPTGKTRWQDRSLAALRDSLEEMFLNLAFLDELLCLVEGQSSGMGLWMRLRAEIDAALRGPGYKFTSFRTELYEAVAQREEKSDIEGNEEPEAEADLREEEERFMAVQIIGDSISSRGAMLLDTLGVSLDQEARVELAMQTKHAVISAVRSIHGK